MAPIYDTDVAEERWSQAEWEHYELWEKIEIRLRRRRRLWIAGTVVLFFLLSSVPIIMDHWPKWSTSAATRQLAEQINRLKREAGTEQMAYRIRFTDPVTREFRVERSSGCNQKSWSEVRTGQVKGLGGEFALVSSEKSGVPGLVDSFCYDYLAGSAGVQASSETLGFGFAPVKDLTESRQDRLAVLLLTGISAEISFE